MSIKNAIEELQKREEHALAMGGSEKIAKRRASGYLDARERLAELLDPGSFSESGMHAASMFSEAREETPADGKITGTGRIDGRSVAVVSNDFTVKGASSSAINMKKIRHMKKLATEQGMPLVLLNESSGARMPDRMGASGRAMLGQDPTEYRRLRETPWAAALLGFCYGSATWYTCMSDFAVMRKGSVMAVASSRVTSIAIGQPVDAEELGGWRLHSSVTGLVDLVVDTDREALIAIRKFLSYLPSHNGETPPVSEEKAKGPPAGEDLLKVFPDSRKSAYDIRKILQCIVDEGSLFELKARFASSLTTTFARLDGRTIGIIANNPRHRGGVIDPDACRKATAFLVLCDSFNIPIIFFVDQPGFLVGLAGEQQGAPGKIINWMNALQLCTVPKITVIIGKDYGQAYLNMGGGRNSDEVLAWPTADLGFMHPEVGVNVLHGLRREDNPEEFERLVQNLSRESSVWDLAAVYEAQQVIDPRSTREVLSTLLGNYRMRRSDGVGKHLLANWPTSY